MKFNKFPGLFAFLAFFIIVQSSSQQKPITLEEIWDGTFQTSRLDELRSMANGREYTVLQENQANKTSSVVAFEYETLRQTQTIVASSTDSGIPYFTSYEFSADESIVLLATEEESLFRRSTQGIYYIFIRETNDLIRISDHKIREPSISPDGTKVAFVFENNLYLFQISSRQLLQITNDGIQNQIINGVTDWVYEEEFSFVRAYKWNATGDRLAYLRFDETAVPQFSMDVFGHSLYPFTHTFKYPKAGEANSKVSLHIYHLETAESRPVVLEQDYYIPRIQWMNHPSHLSIQTLNRHQNQLNLYKVDADTGRVSRLLQETDKAYVEVTDQLNFLPDDRFLWTSEKSGFNHLYLHDQNGKPIRQLTEGPWEITNVYGFDPQHQRIFYQSTENGSINRDLYSIDIRGKDKRRLSTEEGTHEAQYSADYSYYITTFSNALTPPRFTLHNALTGQLLHTIKNNSSLLDKLKGYQLSPKEISTLSVNGNELNMWMVKPPDFDPSNKYPLLLFQYSGPGSQEVANVWKDQNDYWHQLLAQAGYIIACVDGRGTGYKGRNFKKVTYKELGKYEVEDQIEAANKLSLLPYVDENRTGIWGWSYGGFMASNCLLQGNQTFEVAVAVAPVTSWRFYDTIYTERYMQTPQENPAGYDGNSPIAHAHKLKGEFLLVHGSGDDNVHVQNSMQMINVLVQLNKQFDWAIYPDRNHSISGGNTRLHLYTLMTNFLREHL